MTQQRWDPVSAWLLQMCIPLFVLAAAFIVRALDPLHAEQCSTQTALVFLMVYSVVLIISNLFAGDDNDLFYVKMIATVFGPTVLLVCLHHSPYGTTGGFWQECLLPATVVIWSGTASTFMHMRTAIIRCNVRARYAVPISTLFTYITFESLLRPTNFFLNFMICVHALPIIIVSLRHYAASASTAPS